MFMLNCIWAPKSGGKKRGKRVHWVIYKAFGNTFLLARLRLRLQLEIHIRGLRVWSMSCWKTTAGEVSCQTGPGHRTVFKTSLRYLINRIKISVQGLLASFEHLGGRIEEDLNVFQNVFRTVGEFRLGDSKRIQSVVILNLILQIQHKK